MHVLRGHGSGLWGSMHFSPLDKSINGVSEEEEVEEPCSPKLDGWRRVSAQEPSNTALMPASLALELDHEHKQAQRQTGVGGGAGGGGVDGGSEGGGVKEQPEEFFGQITHSTPTPTPKDYVESPPGKNSVQSTFWCFYIENIPGH